MAKRSKRKRKGLGRNSPLDRAEKERIVAQHVVEGKSKAQIRRDTGHAFATIYAAIYAYRDGNLDCEDFLTRYREQMVDKLAELQARATMRAIEQIGDERYAKHAADVAKTAGEMLGKAAGEADLKIAHEVHDARSRVEAKIQQHIEATLIEQTEDEPGAPN